MCCMCSASFHKVNDCSVAWYNLIVVKYATVLQNLLCTCPVIPIERINSGYTFTTRISKVKKLFLNKIPILLPWFIICLWFRILNVSYYIIISTYIILSHMNQLCFVRPALIMRLWCICITYGLNLVYLNMRPKMMYIIIKFYIYFCIE